MILAEQGFPAMAFALNLRGDLAKMSDAELADWLERNWLAYSAAERDRSWWSHTFSFRGPLRHPRFYRMIAAAQHVSGNGLLCLAFILMFGSKRFERTLYRQPDTASHLCLCEIKDITDEMKRRLRHRKATS
jgi:hypothetical protein